MTRLSGVVERRFDRMTVLNVIAALSILAMLGFAVDVATMLRLNSQIRGHDGTTWPGQAVTVAEEVPGQEAADIAARMLAGPEDVSMTRLTVEQNPVATAGDLSAHVDPAAACDPAHGIDAATRTAPQGEPGATGDPPAPCDGLSEASAAAPAAGG